MASSTPAPTTAGKPAEACKPATELYKSKALKVVAILAVVSLAIAMIVGHFSGKSTSGGATAEAGQAGPIITYSSEPPIYFGPSKRVEVDLKPDEWSPVIITPERCKSVSWVINPPVGYFVELPGGKEIEVTPDGKEGFLPPKMSGRGEYRFRGVQAGQKLVAHVTY